MDLFVIPFMKMMPIINKPSLDTRYAGNIELDFSIYRTTVFSLPAS